MAGAARILVIRPLRHSRPLRRLVSFFAAVVSSIARRSEEFAFRLRRRADVVRAALLWPDEKDRRRQELYARKAVQEFTALDENVEAGLTMLEEILLLRHPLPSGARLLVLGCGPGRECVALARLGFEVTGVDREEGMLVRARELAKRNGVAIRFMPGEATAFEFPGQTFDAVVVFSGLYGSRSCDVRGRTWVLAGACSSPSFRTTCVPALPRLHRARLCFRPSTGRTNTETAIS
jgi:tRNA/tmRNA/rRNA uracil-C5-methylase (TrmA/RlmC/RlmD family)